MTNIGEIYKCSICGNVVEVKNAGEGELACCGQPMVSISGTETEVTVKPAEEPKELEPVAEPKIEPEPQMPAQ